MLTIKCQKNIEVAKKYFEEHLTKDEYYSNSTVSPGRWVGALAAKMDLSLDKPITVEQFNMLVDGVNPKNQKPLTQRLSQNRRLFFDATFSAPKSVSIVGLVGQDSRLIKAHNEAVQYAFSELERLAQTRVRVDGQYTDRSTQSLLGAQFLHTTSRENDPQLHTHMVLFNVTFDESEQKFKALQARQIYDQSRLITELYRQKLAFKVRQLGYEIEKAEYGFEIKGVSQELLELYSKRSKGMKGLIFEQEKELGRRLTNNEKAIIAQQTRKKKDKNQSLDEVIDFQRSQLKESQITDLEYLVNEAKLSQIPIKTRDDKSKLVDFLIDKSVLHCFERRSVINTHDLIENTLMQRYGDDISKSDVVSRLKTRSDLIFDDTMTRVGTVKELNREIQMCSIINESKELFEPFLPLATASSQLGTDQNQAFIGVLTSKDQFTSIRGAAGSGKSKLISEIFKNIDTNTTLALAPTTSAKINLTSEFKVQASTVQSFNKKPVDPSLKTLIVDEAGLLSNEDMHSLIIKAKNHNLRIVLIGDTLQHHSVRAGDSLRILEKHSNLETFKLTTIYRQNTRRFTKKYLELKESDPLQAEVFKKKSKKVFLYKQAVKCIVDHQNTSRSFDYLEKMGAIREIDDKAKRMQEFSKEYVKNKIQNEDLIAITPTWKSIQELTDNIRIELKENHLLTNEEFTYKTLSSLKLSDSEKLEFKDKILNKKAKICFFENYENFKPGIDYDIELDKKGRILLSEQSKKEKYSFSPKIENVRNFDILEEKNIAISNGEKLLLQGNFKQNDRFFYNGETVDVKEVKNKEVLLKDGRSLNPERAKLDYGYVSTSISSQGRTHEKSMVHLTNDDGKSLSLNQFYVSISRGRSDISIYVDDKQDIRNRVEEIAKRDSCLELLSSEHNRIPKVSISKPARTKLIEDVGRLKEKHISIEKEREIGMDI